MKIKRIQVKNIGPYVNENAFDFDVSDITKRMVLIGGKNGAGKTTLFNAIKICLYGCVAYGFESNNAKYFAEIEKIINANEKLQKIGEAEVVIDLLMDDGKYDHTYTFVRSWRVAGKKIAETFTVYKDGETLSETEKSDFESYLYRLDELDEILAMNMNILTEIQNAEGGSTGTRGSLSNLRSRQKQVRDHIASLEKKQKQLNGDIARFSQEKIRQQRPMRHFERRMLCKIWLMKLKLRLQRR